MCTSLFTYESHCRHHPREYASVLQCVAVCCSGLQCVAVCCSVLQCVDCRHHPREYASVVRGSCLFMYIGISIGLLFIYAYTSLLTNLAYLRATVDTRRSLFIYKRHCSHIHTSLLTHLAYLRATVDARRSLFIY